VLFTNLMPKKPVNKSPKPQSPAKTTAPITGQSGNFLASLKSFVLKYGSAKLYASACLVILAVTTPLWAILGAKLQLSNADQLVNPYLFENSSTIHNATLPGAHSFLIKWPLFYLVKLFGYTNASFITITVISVLATVAVLVFMLYRIERRPLVFGTICLALASVLLLVPTQAYAGALLPVNMAMLATRNLEYTVYILAIMLFLRAAGRRNHWFWLSIIVLSVLVASDKLFLGISVVAAVLGLAVYALRRRWDMVSLSANWLLAALAGAAAGVALLVLINAIGIVHISSESTGAPYSIVSGTKDLALGFLYAGLGLLTNFGANPAYQATVVRNIPHQLQSGILSISGPTYLINLVILGFCLFGVFHLINGSLTTKKSAKLILDKYTSLALILLLSSLAAFGLFIASNHYYAVDARYLTIALFSLFVCGALFTRNRNWSQKNIVITGAVILAAITFGIFSSVNTYHAQAAALTETNQRNSLVVQVLHHHPVDVLVGDYWRVIPTKAEAGGNLKVLPLSSCFVSREILSSKAWQPDLKNHSFAYLLSLDGSQTDYRGCTLDELISRYGRPNASVLIAGSLSRPKELVLFYDRGAYHSSPKTLLKTPSTILPISLDELPYTSCRVPTIVNIVAHQDDDLLFMNPDLIHDVKAGHCVRTIYVTAGDAGAGQFYWLSRQQGSEAAYSKMIGTDDVWIDRIVEINSHEYITVANPRGNSKISLVFVHLPDGGVKGDGFAATNHESLVKLDSNHLKAMHSVDGQSTYNSSDLVGMLSDLMHIYQPTEIRTQANYVGSRFPDHSDHMAVGRFAKQAHSQYENQQFEGQVSIPIRFYIGYPVHEFPQNVSSTELQEKESVFLSYAAFDGGVCHSIEQCNLNQAYGAYLPRQYQSPN